MSRTTLPTDLQTSIGTTLITGITGSEMNSLTNSTTETDTTITLFNNSSIKVNTVSAGSSVYAEKTGLSISVIDSECFEVPIYIYDTTLVNSLRFDIRFAGSEYFYIYFSTSSFRNGWNKFRVQRKDFLTSGSPSWSNTCTRIRIRLETVSGTPSINLSRITMNNRGIPKILFTFDDARQNVLDYGVPILETYGFKATTWVVKDYSDGGDIPDGYGIGSMQDTTLQTLYNTYNWDIGNHSTTHFNDVSVKTETELLSEYNTCKEWLDGLGFSRSSKFACYPSGSYNDTLISILKGIGTVAARTTILDIQPTPVIDLFKLRTIAIGQTSTLATIQPYIDRTVKCGSTLIFMCHGVYPTATFTNVPVSQRSTTMYSEVLEDICKYLYHLKVDVVRFSDWYDQLTNPRKNITR